MSAVAQRLRQKLLDLAIRGKLVPQDEKDEPAETLLVRIRAERFQTGLGKDGRVEVEKCRKGRACRPQTAVPISEDEKPFDLPKGWTWCFLGELIDLISGVSYQKSDIADKGIRILRGGNIREDHRLHLHDDDVFVSPRLKDIANTIRANDVVIVASTGSASVIGRTAIVKEDYSNVQIGAFLRIARPRFVEFAQWMHIVFVGDYYRKHIRELAKGTNIKNLKSEYITDLPIPLPPLAEQRRIVAALDGMLAAADAVAAGTEKIAALKEKARAKILDLAIRGKLVKQDKNDESAEELLKRIAAERAQLVAQKKLKKVKPLSPIEEDDVPYDLPRGWVWCRLGEIAESFSAKPYQILESDIVKIGKYPVVSQGQKFVDGYCDDETKVYGGMVGADLRAARNCDGIDAPLNANCGADGVRALPVIVFGDHTRNVKYVDFPFVVGADGTKLFHSFVDAKWTYYWTLHAASVAMESRGYGRHWNVLCGLPIPLPPLAEQHRIVAKVDEMLAACDALSGGARGA